MLNIERRNEILDYLKINKSATVSGLAKMLFIGEATIRRDLSLLEKEGTVKRIYGGAYLVEGVGSEIPLYVREYNSKAEKDKIGAAAARLVNNGDVIILDSSSTTYSMVKYLKDISCVTIITNGAKTALSLSGIPCIKVYSTGGMLREHSLSYIGSSAMAFIENIYADKLFFSCRALSLKNGLLDISVEESELRKLMIAHTREVILLADSSKFEKEAFYKICNLDKIDILVTDYLPNSVKSELEKMKIKIVFC